jgi:hypothetical protein
MREAPNSEKMESCLLAGLEQALCEHQLKHHARIHHLFETVGHKVLKDLQNAIHFVCSLVVAPSIALSAT